MAPGGPPDDLPVNPHWRSSRRRSRRSPAGRRTETRQARGASRSVSLAEGKSETWIRDRTAHKTTTMIDRYRRTAPQFQELGVAGLVAIVDAL
jgi:hypothetical protein